MARPRAWARMPARAWAPMRPWVRARAPTHRLAACSAGAPAYGGRAVGYHTRPPARARAVACAPAAAIARARTQK